MEDLRLIGFRMWDKTTPTTIDNIRLVMKEIGKFHAISFAMKDQRPEIFANFEKLTYNKDGLCGDLFTKMFNRCFSRTINALHNDYHKEILSKFQVNFSKYMLSHFHKDIIGKFPIITHNDLWSSNIMYRFNENVCTKMFV